MMLVITPLPTRTQERMSHVNHRNGCEARKRARHKANMQKNLPSGLNAQAERRDIDEQNLVGRLAAVALQNGRLHCSAVGNGLVRVDAAARLLSVEEVANELLHF